MKNNVFFSFFIRWFYPLFFLGLLCIFGAFCYANFPSTDDYLQSLFIKDHGRLEVMRIYYLFWTGRYAGIVWAVFTQPMSYNSILLYKIFPLFVLGLFATSVYYFLKRFVKTVTFQFRVVLLTFFLLVFYDQMPSVKDGFFWYSATWYVTGCSFVLFFWVSLDRALNEKSLKLWLIAGLLGLLCAGHIEMFLQAIIFIHFLYLINDYLLHKKVSKPLIFSFLFLLIAGLFSILAPGNFLRSEAIGKLNQNIYLNDFSFSIKMSLKYLVQDFIQRILTSPVILLITLLSVFYQPQLFDFKRLRIPPIFLFVMISSFFISVYFLFYYGVGTDEPVFSRINNATLFFMIIAFVFLVNYSLFWYKVRVKSIYNLKVIYAIHLIIVFLFFVSENNIHESLKSFRAKDYLAYKDEIDKRMELVKSHPNDTLIVDSLNFFPKMIFNFDITADFNEGLNNQSFARYWGLKAIRVKGEPPVKGSK